MLLDADGQLGQVVVDLVGDPPPLLLLGQEQAPDQVLQTSPLLGQRGLRPPPLGDLLVQGALPLPRLGDVQPSADDALGLAHGVAHHLGLHDQDALRAIAAGGPDLDRVGAALVGARHEAHDHRMVVRVHRGQEAGQARRHLARGVAQQTEHLVRPVHDACRQVPAEVAEMGDPLRRLEPGVALVEGLLRRLTRGDVGADLQDGSQPHGR